MSQKRDNTRKNIVVWHKDKQQDTATPNKPVIRVVNKNPEIHVAKKLAATITDSTSAAMTKTSTQNKTGAVKKLLTPNVAKGLIPTNQKLSSPKICAAAVRQKQKSVTNQRKSVNSPPSNIVPSKAYSQSAQINCITKNSTAPSTTRSRLSGFDNLRTSVGKKSVPLNDINTGDDVTKAEFQGNHMIVYGDVISEEQDNETMEYEDIEMLNDALFANEAGEEKIYHSEKDEEFDDSTEKIKTHDGDENNNSSNSYSNNSIEGCDESDNTEETNPQDHQIQPIDPKEVESCRNVVQSACCDRCKDVNRIILCKLNEIIELLNASNYKVGTANIPDFSRLGNFPLQSVKDVENFESRLKEDDSLMELYKTKISRIGGDNPEAAVRSALKAILTDEVAVRYSWTGLKKTIKFSQHKIVDGIIETIMKSGNTTLTDLQNTVKEWLRHAGDRVRYQLKKELKAIQHT